MSIIIDKAKYNASNNSIDLVFTLKDTGPLESITAWTEDTYRGSTGTTIAIPAETIPPSNTKTLNIPLTSIGSPDNVGLQFFHISTSTILATPRNAGKIAEGRIVCIGNLTKYHECLTNKLLKVNIPCERNGCDCEDEDEKCKEIMDDCGNNIFYITALLNTIYRAINCSEWQKAADILNAVKEATKDCCTIEKTGDRKNDINIYVIKDKVELCVQDRIVS